MKGFYPEGFSGAGKAQSAAFYTETNLKEAMISGEILTATAYMCDGEHTLICSLGSMKGIIPRNEGAVGIEEGETRDIALISRVGKPVCFTVSEIKEDENGTKYALLSRKNAQPRACRRRKL